MANTPWCGSQADKLYLQSGQFSATLKTSLDIGGVDITPKGVSYDGTNSPWTGSAGDKLYLQSGQFSATMKTSLSINAVDNVPTGISWDGVNSPWVGEGDVKLYLQSGQFSATLKTSLSVSAVETTSNGVSYDGTNTPWAGRTGDKLYLQSGQFSATMKTSLSVTAIDGSPRGITWDGVNTPWAGSGGDKLYLQSGQFSVTMKTSLAVGGVDNLPTGIDTSDVDARLGISAGTIFERLVTDGMLFDDPFAKHEEHLLPEAVQFFDERLSEMTFQQTDALLIGDTTLLERLFDLAFTDAIEMDDIRGGDQDKPRGDQVLLDDTRRSLLEKLVLDLLLVDENTLTQRIKFILAEDDLFLGGDRLSATEARQGDTLILFDDFGSERSLTGLDFLLVADTRVSEVLKTIIDDLFAGDTALAQKLKIVLAVDGLLLRDNRASDITKLLVDALLIGTQRRSDLSKIILDGVLVNSLQVVDRAKEVIARDGLLLSDDRTAVIDKTIINHLLLASFLSQIVDKVVRDDLFLLDDAILEIIAEGLELVVTDGLFLFDGLIKDHEKTATDSVLLDDAAVRESLKLLVDAVVLGSADAREALFIKGDGILLDEATATERALVASNGLLLDSVLIKALDKLVDVDGLLLRDAVTKLVVVGGVTEALVFALLGFKDILGATAGIADNLLAFKTASRDLLMATTGTVRTGD